jgi:hypothetical protein
LPALLPPVEILSAIVSEGNAFAFAMSVSLIWFAHCASQCGQQRSWIWTPDRSSCQS